MIARVNVPAVFRRQDGTCEVRVSIGADESVTFTLRDGDVLEVLDAKGIEAVRSLGGALQVTELAVRPGRIDHDVDAKPRGPRPREGRG